MLQATPPASRIVVNDSPRKKNFARGNQANQSGGAAAAAAAAAADTQAGQRCARGSSAASGCRGAAARIGAAFGMLLVR